MVVVHRYKHHRSSGFLALHHTTGVILSERSSLVISAGLNLKGYGIHMVEVASLVAEQSAGLIYEVGFVIAANSVGKLESALSTVVLGPPDI